MENLEPLENFRQIYLKKLLKSIINLENSVRYDIQNISCGKKKTLS